MRRGTRLRTVFATTFKYEPCSQRTVHSVRLTTPCNLRIFVSRVATLSLCSVKCDVIDVYNATIPAGNRGGDSAGRGCCLSGEVAARHPLSKNTAIGALSGLVMWGAAALGAPVGFGLDVLKAAAALPAPATSGQSAHAFGLGRKSSLERWWTAPFSLRLPFSPSLWLFLSLPKRFLANRVGHALCCQGEASHKLN